MHSVPVRQKNAQSRPDPLADKSISITRRYKRKVERMSSLCTFWALYPILIPGQSAKLKKLPLFTQIIEDNKLPSYISNQNFSNGNFRLLKLTLAVLG